VVRSILEDRNAVATDKETRADDLHLVVRL
jgi:hypothetical protein